MYDSVKNTRTNNVMEKFLALIYSIYCNNTRREVSQAFFFIAKRNILCKVSCLVLD